MTLSVLSKRPRGCRDLDLIGVFSAASTPGCESTFFTWQPDIFEVLHDVPEAVKTCHRDQAARLWRDVARCGVVKVG